MPLVDSDVGALAVSHNVALDDSPLILVAASSRLLYGWLIHNRTSADAYVQLFNAAEVGDVTLGTTKPRMVIPMLANDIDKRTIKPVLFDLGIVIGSTTTIEGSSAAIQDVDILFA